MSEVEPVLFLPVRPKFADLYRMGYKSADLRKSRAFPIRHYDVVLYATSPRCGVFGAARLAGVEGVVVDQDGSIMVEDLVRRELGLTDDEIRAYLGVGRAGWAFRLERIFCFSPPIALRDLRAAMPTGWRVPQGYGFLRGDAAAAMRRLCGLGGWRT